MSERNYWLGFSIFSGIGPMKFKKLLERFGSAKDAWEASKSDLEEVVGEKLAERFNKFRNEFSISDYAAKVQSKNVSFLTLEDKEYPSLLSQIKNPPFVLYVKGDKKILKQVQDDSENRRYIAVVGTRRTTQYGREVTALLTQELVAAGFTIVSGLAIGVDAISHKTAIENSGKTIAVLGCGVDCCYPSANQHIYNSIVKSSGCILSEYPLGTRPTKGSFPSRNRIIAGLSIGVLVTEGAEDSGSLITADYARKFGRPVFAVPGPITSGMSKGPYKLIQRGAKLVTKAEDILKEFKIQNSKGKITTQNSKVNDATKEEMEILKLLQNEPLHFDELVRRTRFDSSKIGALLSLMEIKGLIKGLESGQFSITS
ncbi:MAG: DNA-processing protein DprA [Patescibacteria group bacterium]